MDRGAGSRWKRGRARDGPGQVPKRSRYVACALWEAGAGA